MTKGDTMTKYWCVNFDAVEYLHHGIRNKLWLMDCQYANKGTDTPGRKSAITRNWKRLEEINVGDRFVAYLPGNKIFAVATVISPRRPKTSQDRTDEISNYLKRGKSYKSGFVCLPQQTGTAGNRRRELDEAGTVKRQRRRRGHPHAEIDSSQEPSRSVQGPQLYHRSPGTANGLRESTSS